MPKGIPLTPEQVSEALLLRRRCWTNGRIAERLGVHPDALARALARHQRRALARLEARTAAIKAQQVDQLDWVAEEAAEAWERSKQDAVRERTKTVETGPSEGGGDAVVLDTRTETETIRAGQAGDPRFLERVQGALAEQRKILGLDKVRPGANDNVTVVFDLGEEDDQAEGGGEEAGPGDGPGGPAP